MTYLYKHVLFSTDNITNSLYYNNYKWSTIFKNENHYIVHLKLNTLHIKYTSVFKFILKKISC